MDFEKIYNNIQSGELSIPEARKKLSINYIEEISKNTFDINRKNRTKIPEIIYGEYKTAKQIKSLVNEALKKNDNVIVSRYKNNKKLAEYFSEKSTIKYAKKIIVIGQEPKPTNSALIISAGASDHDIAEEVKLALSALGTEPILFEDRGISHPTRVLEALKVGFTKKIKTVVIIAGMEASLATYVSSIVDVPVIGVPTSVGYGYKAKESALISMLSACTPNLAVVNIDGGIRAAVLAHLISNPS